MKPRATAGEVLLGIEAGGTRTVALVTDGEGQVCQRLEAGPANLRLLDDASLTSHFRQLAKQLPRPVAVGIGMAGVREESDRARVRRAAADAWPGVPCWAGNDLETALAAAGFDQDAGPATQIIIISGTGSCCFGRNARGREVKVGGWGHLLGDRGSGYDVALQALRRVIQDFDASGRWPALGARLLRALVLNEPNDLITWIHAAAKPDVAALAPEVFAAAQAGDRLARRVVAEAGEILAADATACARHLGDRSTPVAFHLVGGVFHHQPAFVRQLRARLRREWPKSEVSLLRREGVWGAVHRARELAMALSTASVNATQARPRPYPVPRATDEAWIPPAAGLSPTEERNPRSLQLDRLSVGQGIELMLSEEARVAEALRGQRAALGRGVHLVVRALRRGGRLFYVGAGTSGRLGVLDASECPPTFSTSPDLVQGIMAGGTTALWRSMEGAEDDARAGAQAVTFRGVGRRDVVLGIAASGRTPFVWGALAQARAAGAATGLICFNPRLRFVRAMRPDVVIAADTGPEVLTGSTRLKAGTATKLILNLITTLAMVQLGKVASNLMVDVQASNTKLRDRAVRIVRELTGATEEAAKAALVAHGWRIPLALEPLGYRKRRARL